LIRIALVFVFTTGVPVQQLSHSVADVFMAAGLQVQDTQITADII